MESANFIPLGATMVRASFDQPGSYTPKVIGETPEERKRIAREIRLAARKEKKKIKSDAKKQRKQNAIMHRRMTRNNEKYDKNKERNRRRAIDLERTTIRERAIQQVEQLAAQHDPSGKLFNVGEVVILPDGTVKSKERMRKAEEARIQRQAERKAEAEAKQAASEAKMAAKEARKNGEVSAIDGVDPQRLAQIETVPGAPPPKRMSKTQQKKLEMYAPKPVPPKPVIPEGITLSLHAGEENFLALWDITDEQIQRRLGEVKRKKALARRQLKLQQKKEKAFRRQMKAKKKQAHNRGEDFDPERAAQEILAAQKVAQNQTRTQSDSTSISESDSESDEDVETYEVAKEAMEVTVEASRSSINIDTKQAKKAKKSSYSEPADVKIEPLGAGSSSDKRSKKCLNPKKLAGSDGEFKPKKSKKSKAHTTEDTEIARAPVTQGSGEARIKDKANEKNDKTKPDAVEANSDQEAQAKVLEEFVRKEKRLLKREKKQRDTLATSSEVAVGDGSSSKKRKRADDQEQESKPKKAHKKSEVQAEELFSNEALNGTFNTAEQWNPEALTGDEARKEKFLRLLGAKKSKGESSTKHKSKSRSADISQVQSDLEKQYEAGMKLKHDGRGKRRGLGA